jgi:AAA family ATP:ADP antiporter
MSHTISHPAERAVPRAGEHRGLLDRTLGLVADVRGGEGVTALLLMLNIFFLLASYYLLKTIREPLILSQPGGAEVKSYAAAAIAGVLIVLVPIYSAIASRVSRVRLINGVTLFFILCLIGFFMADRIGYAVGTVFFIWVGIFNLMVIAQLWAFANDVYTVDQGKRLFAIVGVGASLGAIAGSFVTGKLVKAFGPYPFMLAAAAILGICMVLTNLINLREKRGVEGQPETPGDQAAAADAPAAGDEKDAKRSGFALVLTNKYLLLIAALMILSNLVNTTGEYILGKTIVNVLSARQGGALDEEKAIGAFYGNYFTIVNIISFAIQAFVVSRILKWFGVRTALLVLPFVALIGYASMAFVPVLSFIRGAKIAENSLDYSLQNTTRNALYLPTSRAAKYKAKQANDTFFVRLGDVLSAGLVFAGTTWLAFKPTDFARVALALILIWLGIAFALGRMFQRQAKTA